MATTRTVRDAIKTDSDVNNCNKQGIRSLTRLPAGRVYLSSKEVYHVIFCGNAFTLISDKKQIIFFSLFQIIIYLCR